MNDGTWDEGTDLVSSTVLVVIAGLLLAATAPLRWLRRHRGPQMRPGPAYCQARHVCVARTHGCDCPPEEARDG